jgi:hypothetical protein
MRQQQIKVSLSDEVRTELEAAAENAGRSLSEEVRLRLERSIGDDRLEPQVRDLVASIVPLSVYVNLQTGHRWYDHAAAARVFLHAITARLTRIIGQPDLTTATFAPGELPTNRLVAAGSDDPAEMGRAVESVQFHTTQPDHFNWRQNVDAELRRKGKSDGK